MTYFFMSLVLFLKPILFILSMTDILKRSPVINYDFVSFVMQKSGKKLIVQRILIYLSISSAENVIH